MGAIAIAMGFRGERLRRERRRRILALVLACVGVLSELLYIHYDEGLGNVLSSPVSVWMLIGQIVFGIHLLYRIYAFTPAGVTN